LGLLVFGDHDVPNLARIDVKDLIGLSTDCGAGHFPAKRLPRSNGCFPFTFLCEEATMCPRGHVGDAGADDKEGGAGLPRATTSPATSAGVGWSRSNPLRSSSCKCWTSRGRRSRRRARKMASGWPGADPGHDELVGKEGEEPVSQLAPAGRAWERSWMQASRPGSGSRFRRSTTRNRAEALCSPPRPGRRTWAASTRAVDGGLDLVQEGHYQGAWRA